MSIPDEKAPEIPPPLEQEVRAARRLREPLRWLPYYVGAFMVLPFLERWLRPVLKFSLPVRRGLTLVVAVLAGFLMHMLVERLRDPPDRSLPRDRDRAV